MKEQLGFFIYILYLRMMNLLRSFREILTYRKTISHEGSIEGLESIVDQLLSASPEREGFYCKKIRQFEYAVYTAPSEISFQFIPDSGLMQIILKSENDKTQKILLRGQFNKIQYFIGLASLIIIISAISVLIQDHTFGFLIFSLLFSPIMHYWFYFVGSLPNEKLFENFKSAYWKILRSKTTAKRIRS